MANKLDDRNKQPRWRRAFIVLRDRNPRVAVRIALAVCLAAGVSSLWSATASAFVLPPMQTGANLAECVAALEQQGGGWCEIRRPGEDPSIQSVWPDLDNRTRMVTGPRSVLGAWNGGAFDEEKGLLYFTGGGHADYGGNEVYEFDLNTGQWARLTDPSPLTFVFQVHAATAEKAARYCWSPDMRREPASVHNYDGVQFSRKTKTMFLVASAPATGSCFDDEEGAFDGDPRVVPGTAFSTALYEFNPSRDETRNGLPPLTWRHLPYRRGLNMSFPRSLELPDGRMMLGGQTTLYNFDPVSGTVGERLWEEPNRGDGLAEYHPSGVILTLHGGSLRIDPIKPGMARIMRLPGVVDGKSLQVAANGVVFSWDGANKIFTFDLSGGAPVVHLYDWGADGPAVRRGRVYSKWQYIAAHDVFVGLSTHETGVWVYQHPEGMPGERIVEPDR